MSVSQARSIQFYSSKHAIIPLYITPCVWWAQKPPQNQKYTHTHTHTHSVWAVFFFNIKSPSIQNSLSHLYLSMTDQCSPEHCVHSHDNEWVNRLERIKKYPRNVNRWGQVTRRFDCVVTPIDSNRQPHVICVCVYVLASLGKRAGPKCDYDTAALLTTIPP